MAERKLAFDLKILELGKPLRFDIEREDGEMLANRGNLVTQELLNHWVSQGITTAVAVIDPHEAAEPLVDQHASASVLDAASEASALLAPYDEQALLRLGELFDNASAATLRAAQLLAGDDLKNCREVSVLLDGFLQEVEADLAAVLCAFQHQNDATPPLSSKDAALAARCAKMSVLATVVSSVLDYGPVYCQQVGLAGMLHDISLFDQVQDTLGAIYGRTEEGAQSYQTHPLQSASLLTYVAGVTDITRHVITQVHEEPSGQGFPLGQDNPRRIHRLAKVLHVVDAYLTLTLAEQPEPMPVAANLVPADAIAYLMNHARRGSFDVATVRGLIDATSLYPVGTTVQLNDLSTATVLRSSGTAPTDPIVRLDGGEQRIVDLRDSHLSIVRPVSTGSHAARRLAPASLDDVLWRRTAQ